jgi:anti-sigma B factor antagonist
VSDPSIHPAQTVGTDPLALEFERTTGGALRGVASGEIDFSSASSMQARIIAACEREGTSEVILDLAGVQFIDSSGLGALMHLHRELSTEDGELVLLDPAPQVRHSLLVTGLDRHLTIAASDAEAEALLRRDQESPGEQRP